MKLSEYNDMMSPEDLAREKMFNEFLSGIDDLINNADKYIEKTASDSKFQTVMPRSPFDKGLVKVSDNPDVFEAVEVEPASSVKEVSDFVKSLDNTIDVEFPKSVADSDNPYFSSDEITESETDNYSETELENQNNEVDIADTTQEGDVGKRKHSTKKSPINKPVIIFAAIVLILAILVSFALFIL